MNHREQAYAELLLLQEQGVHMDPAAIHRAGYDAALALAHELATALEAIYRSDQAMRTPSPYSDICREALDKYHAATAAPSATP
jgi:hypothetical protein